MHSKDVTEILRVLEKRITKLESRVSELELKADEHRDKPSQSTHDTMSSLSSRTVSYDQGSKIVFDKKSILDHRKILQSAGKMEGYSRIVRTPTVESVGSGVTAPLEDGEIFEGKGQLESVAQVTKERTPRKTPAGPKVHSPIHTNTRAKRGNGRERSKSDPTGTGSIKEPSPPPASKTEMHYGLVVQFPADR